ncbi:MAG: D-glycero-beta-D-manno-heptose-7-phosphate kinase, partial [Bacteroidetes bacterium]|nr:D-glycero-beta-D-manno-heptose-7-phosphate kinase [Bacteroidota bacterium]
MHQQDFQKNAFANLQVLVIGDVMIDRYFYGEVNRQSPEADVPILDVGLIENRLGGAANVALNIAKMGAKAHLMSLLGADEDAAIFKDLLKEQGVCFKLVESNRKTTVKARLYKGNEYLMRYDFEDKHDIEEDELEQLLANVKLACEKLSLNAIVLQDYNKGVLSEKSIKSLIDLIKPFGIPIVVDPKEKNFFAYQAVSLFKPNLKELNKALSLNINPQDDVALEAACAMLRERLDCEMVLITRAQYGAIGANENA